MRSPPPGEEGEAEITCDELTVNPIPCPPALLWRVSREFGSEAVPGKKGGVGGRCFKIWDLLLIILNLIYYKSNQNNFVFFLQVEPVFCL